MNKINKLINSLKFDLRLAQPWNYKFPLILSFAYLGIHINNLHILQSIILLSAFLLCMIGVSAFAYLINDYFDQTIDKLYNKKNIFLTINPKYFSIYILTSLFAIVYPWTILPWNKNTLLLLSLLLSAFIIYSAPQTRIKNKGILGVFLDAIYAYLLSSYLTFYTFALIDRSHYDKNYYILCVIFLWQLSIGIRSIIFHQIKDYNNDLSHNNTWVVKIGINKALKILKTYILPLEITMLISSLFIISKYFILIIPFSIFFWILIILKYKYIFKQSLKWDYQNFTYIFLDDYYYQCYPTLILLFMSILNLDYAILLAIHIFLFKNIIFNYLNDLKNILIK